MYLEVEFIKGDLLDGSSVLGHWTLLRCQERDECLLSELIDTSQAGYPYVELRLGIKLLQEERILNYVSKILRSEDLQSLGCTCSFVACWLVACARVHTMVFLYVCAILACV